MMGGLEPEGESVSVDTSVPHIARVYDYWLGGKVAAFFAGLDLVEPGLVQLHRWRAGTGDPGTRRELANYGGLGRKP